MAAQALPKAGGVVIQEALLHSARNSTKKEANAKVNLSLNPCRNNMPNARLAKGEKVSEARNLPLLQENSVLSSLSICADSFTTDENSTIALTPDKLHQWMTESITEIVRHIGEAPFLYYIFDRNVSSTTPKRQRVPEDMLQGADSWQLLKKSLRNVSPDGVILVKRLDEDSIGEYLTAPEREKDNGMQDFNRSGGTNIWGLLIQGRGVVSACYILKTTQIISTHGCCTQFCLTKAKCFGASPRTQFTQSWLL